MTAKPAVERRSGSRACCLCSRFPFSLITWTAANLSIAAPLLKNEFHFSATQLGFCCRLFLDLSFFLPVSGWLVARLDVKMGDRRRFFSLVRSNRGYRRGACVWHIASSRDWRWARENRFLSGMLDHFVAVFPGAQTWLRNASIVAGMALGPAVRHARWRNYDEPIWVAPGFLVWPD